MIFVIVETPGGCAPAWQDHCEQQFVQSYYEWLRKLLPLPAILTASLRGNWNAVMTERTTKSGGGDSLVAIVLVGLCCWLATVLASVAAVKLKPAHETLLFLDALSGACWVAIVYFLSQKLFHGVKVSPLAPEILSSGRPAFLGKLRPALRRYYQGVFGATPTGHFTGDAPFFALIIFLLLPVLPVLLCGIVIVATFPTSLFLLLGALCFAVWAPAALRTARLLVSKILDREDCNENLHRSLRIATTWATFLCTPLLIAAITAHLKH